MKTDDFLEPIYQPLFSTLGPWHWWPADTAKIVVIGAILAQNVAWENARKGICPVEKWGSGKMENFS